MSRRRQATKRQHLPDARYSSPLVSQLINVVMKCGKKSVAQSIVYGAIERVSEKLEKGDPVELLLGALENCRPKLEVKSRRVGGATYQVPVEISHERQTSMAFRWLAAAASARKGAPMTDSLAAEIVDAYNNTGTVVKKREETHKMAQANRAFAHLRWGNNS
jgi:small subunit ribosomal protein S7